MLNLYMVIRQLRRVREKLATLMVQGGFLSFGSNSVLGLPVTLWRQDFISVGKNVYLGPGSWLQVTSNARTEKGVAVIEIMDGVSVTGTCFISAREKIVIEKNVLMGRFVHISDHSHAFGDVSKAIKHQGVSEGRAVRIGEGAWLGQGVVVLPGVSIGRNSVIGANSVVKNDIPDYCVAVGAPARVVRKIAES
jgi:acetyltransferase-like isoleucine patch superfamily enzyme